MNDDDREELGWWDGRADGLEGRANRNNLDTPYGRGYDLGYKQGAKERLANVL